MTSEVCALNAMTSLIEHFTASLNLPSFISLIILFTSIAASPNLLQATIRRPDATERTADATPMTEMTP